MNIIEVINNYNDEFKYQLLSRLLTDCKYYLGQAGRNASVLWAKNVEDQVSYALALYNSFPEKKRPEWTSAWKIITIGEEMGVKLARAEHLSDAILANAQAAAS